MSKKFILTAAVIVAIAAASYFVFKQVSKRASPSSAVSGGTAWGYSIQGGLTRAYAFELSSEAKIDTGVLKMDPSKEVDKVLTGRAADVKTSARGELRFKFYSDPGGGFNVAGMISGFKISMNGGTPGWVWAVEYPFTFEMAANGAVDAFQFVPALPGEAAAFVTHLVYELQAVLPEKRRSSWTAVETDASGKMEAAYTELEWNQAAGALKMKKERRKLTASKHKTPDIPFMANPTVNIIKSDIGISATMRGWIEELSGSDTTAYLAGGMEWSRSESRESFKSIDAGPDGFPATFAEFQASLKSQKLIGSMFGHTDPEMDKLAAGMNMGDALAHYLELKKTDKNAAEKFMVNYLRMHPEAPGDLLRELDRDRTMNKYDEKTQLILWRLVAEAGTPEAQKAIMDAATDPSFGRLSHVRGILYSTHFENPQKFMVERMLELHRNPAMNGEVKSTAATGNMSMLAVGSIGYRDKLNDETKELVARELTDNLRRSSGNNDETALTLKAIGNTGNGSLLETVKPYFDSGDEQVRKAAAESLRRMDGAEAQQQLIDQYGRDQSQKVREATLKSLFEMPLTAESVAWARDALLAAGSPGETVMLIEILGKTLQKYPENDAALRNLLSRNPSVPIKETVYKFIAPK
jgi:hypothetical protein